MVRLRRASGGREEGLLKRAEALRRSVEPLLPERTRDCPEEPFERLRQDLEAVREVKDDAARLDRMRRWGDPFPRAYAGFLHFYLDSELPTLLSVRVGGQEVSFAPLARTDPEYQVAVQHYEDPRRLLLAYLALARKGLHFYALPNRLLCAGKSPTPPPEFLRRQDEALPYRFDHGGEAGRFLCPHLAHGDWVPWLGVDWTSAGRTFRICQRCAREDAQLLGALAAGIAQPKAEDAFAVTAELNVDCRGGPDCVHHRLPPLSRRLIKSYTNGRVSDREMIVEFVRETEPEVARAGGPLFIAGGVCYGTDRAQFMQALHPTRVERSALEQVLPSVDSVFQLTDPTASQALERLWRTHAEEIVQAIEPDPEEAQRLVQEARAAPGRISDLLRRAARKAEERQTLSALPQYEGLGPEAAFADGVARSFRIGGPEPAERRIESTLPREGKERGVAWGMLLAIGRSTPHTWQFSDTERGFGQSLEAAARALLEAPPSEYDAALQHLLSQAGVAPGGNRARPA